MLFSIVPCFSNTWFLLCLERLDADWLNGCVCLEGLHSDCFCCIWYCYHAFSLDECPFCPVGSRIFYCACILIGWVVCSGLEKDPFKNKYHSRLIFCGESKSGLEIKEFPVEMPFLGGRGVPLFWSTYIHTHDRLDKLRSALAEAQLKILTTLMRFMCYWDK